MKKVIEQRTDVLGGYSSHTLAELTARLQAKLDDLTPEQRETAKFTIDTRQESYSDSVYADLYMVYKRLETDEEETKREANELQRKLATEARDRQEFERLQSKYGSKE